MRSTKPSSYCKKLVKKGKTLAQLAKNAGEKTRVKLRKYKGRYDYRCFRDVKDKGILSTNLWQ